MSSSQYGFSIAETGSCSMMPMAPDNHVKRKRPSMDFFKNKLRHDDAPPSPGASHAKRRTSLDFFKKSGGQNDGAFEADYPTANDSRRSVRFSID